MCIIIIHMPADLCTQHASSCSERFSVTNHSVVIVRGDGEVVRESITTSSEVNLQLVVGGIERDTRFSVQVEACNVFTCRRSSSQELCEFFSQGEEQRRVGKRERRESGRK